MNPRIARKLALFVSVVNVLLILTIINVAVLLLVDFLSEPVPVWKEDVPPKVLSQQATKSLASMRYFWQANILATEPKQKATKPKIVSQKVIPKPPKKIIKPVLPFLVVATFEHTNRHASYAVLEDKRARKQILVKVNSSLPKCKYKVMNITKDTVHFQWKDITESVSIENPKRLAAQKRK